MTERREPGARLIETGLEILKNSIGTAQFTVTDATSHSLRFYRLVVP